MKFLVVGLGSMGQRRIRLLSQNFKGIELVGVDTNEERVKNIEKLNMKVYRNIEKAIISEKPDAALICTSPLSHSDLIIKCLENNINIFTEINLTDDKYDEIIYISNLKKLILFLSSTPMYRKEIQCIKQLYNKEQKINYRYHVGQYLPDWHPWENYKDFFVKDKKSNGCREILAIELPWIIDTFGEIEKFYVIKDKITSLEIQYPDIYCILLKHKNGNIGTLNIDIVSRKAIRSFEMYNENMHVFWDGTPKSLKVLDIDSKNLNLISTYDYIQKNNNYSENIIENAYIQELNAFILSMKGDNSLVRYSFNKDKYIINLIDKIEGVI